MLSHVVRVTSVTVSSGSFWQSVTTPQATLLSGVLTVFAAIFGVILGWKLLDGKVKNLQEALAKSLEYLATHRQGIELSLKDMNEKIVLELSATAKSLGQLRGDVADNQSVPPPPQAAAPDEIIGREDLRSSWEKIKSKLEDIAADPSIDGRTRAKYSRLDRRQYRTLVDALNQDGLLDHYEDYIRGLAIWQQYKTNRAAPSVAARNDLRDLAQKLTAEP